MSNNLIKAWLVVFVGIPISVAIYSNTIVDRKEEVSEKVSLSSGMEYLPNLIINDKSAAYLEDTLDSNKKTDPSKVTVIDNEDLLFKIDDFMGKKNSTLKEIYGTNISPKYFYYYVNTTRTTKHITTTKSGKKKYKTNEEFDSEIIYPNKDTKEDLPKTDNSTEYKLKNKRSERTWWVSVSDFETDESK